MLDARVENGSRKIDADVHGGVREILTGTPEDHGFTRPDEPLVDAVRDRVVDVDRRKEFLELVAPLGTHAHCDPHPNCDTYPN